MATVLLKGAPEVTDKGKESSRESENGPKDLEEGQSPQMGDRNQNTRRRALQNLRVPVLNERKARSDGIRAPGISAGNPCHEWYSLQQLLEGFQSSPKGTSSTAEEDPDSNNAEVETVGLSDTQSSFSNSIWYRLSIIDLDLKQSSKIPQ